MYTMANYKDCQFQNQDCGNLTYRKDGEKCFILKNLDSDMASMFNANRYLPEYELIAMRASTQLNVNQKICAYHRFSLGKFWKPSSLCAYPQHVGSMKTKGRNISWNSYEKVFEIFPNFILGSLMCATCLEKIKISKTKLEVDYDYTPDRLIFDEDEKTERQSKLNELTNIFGMKPIQFLIQKNVDSLGKTSKNYFKKIFHQMENKLKDMFCSLVAPGQENLLKMILDDTSDNKEEIDDISPLVNAFKGCLTRNARLAVLTLVPKKFSKQHVTDTFGCTMYEISYARSLLKKYGPCAEKPTIEKLYIRLDKQKAMHFIDFLFSSGILQEEAYGTCKIKMDDGTKITVSNTILNGLHEHAVREYQIYCKEIEYPCLSSTTLRKILINIKPKTRKRLAGIDNFVVEGIEAFELLMNSMGVIKEEQKGILLVQLKQAKTYLKARYRTHCELHNDCASHCISNALSHPTDTELNKTCNRLHDSVCEDCLNIVELFTNLKKETNYAPDSFEKEILLNDINMAESKIIEWQRHIIRGVQQSKARDAAFNQLNESTALWIRDWAQKINPSKAMESQAEYFGKRGMSMSVEVFITKYGDIYHKFVYLVILDQCDQSMIDTLCVADTVLCEFHKDHPFVKFIRIKTDNAGCYHANGVVEAMEKLGNQNQIRILSYDYNEPQLGKDQSDREAAIVKRKLESEIIKNETNKVTNGRELMETILAGEGLKNTKVCVVQIDKTKSSIKGFTQVPNISYFHSMTYSHKQHAISYNEFFGIGSGKMYKVADVSFQNGVDIIEGWRSSVKQGQRMSSGSSSRSENVLSCDDPICISSFKNEHEKIEHLAKEQHVYAHIKSGMDSALMYFIQQKNIRINQVNTFVADYKKKSCVETDTFYNNYHKGWARKQKTINRFTEKQKKFIKEVFEEGEKTQKKKSPEQIAAQMRNFKVNEEFYFHPSEYLMPNQIRGFLTRIKHTSKGHISKKSRLDDDSNFVEELEDICELFLGNINNV